ncbi:MAG: hypothetical protein U9Q82_09380 [Chloroflexota bacterium]|nr:hypothetical protein [Chloroflexota bacterium]
MQNQSPTSKTLRKHTLAAAVEGLTALVFLFCIPGDPNNAWFLGLSKMRFAAAAGLFVAASAFAVLTFTLWRNDAWEQRLGERLSGALQTTTLYVVLIILSFVGVIACSQLLWLAYVIEDPFIKAYLVRIAPLLFWGGALGLQTILAVPLFRHNRNLFNLSPHIKILRTSALILVGLFFLWGIVAVSRIGIKPDVGGWDTPGAPILAAQAWLAWALGMLILSVEMILSTNSTASGRVVNDEVFHRSTKGMLREADGTRYSKARSLEWLDIVISIFLWTAAFWIWARTPMSPSYFAPEPRVPNFDYYPYSDAAYYDLSAQRLLVGQGFSGIPMKPLYAMFLALSHTVAGQEYADVVKFQIAVLALLPVLIYWLVKSLHFRVSGLIAAALIILRERNAISLSSDIRVSHSKLLMSGMPGTLAIVLFAWLLIRWLQKPDERRWYPLAMGGILGLLMLIRPQTLILALAVGFFIVLISLRRFVPGLINAGFFALGIGLTLFPWLWRSYQTTGRVTLNSPEQMAYFTQLYTLDPWDSYVHRQPDESDGQYAQRVNDYLFDFLRHHPDKVAKFTSAHFMHNEVSMLLALPMSPWFVQNPNMALSNYGLERSPRFWGACCSTGAYVTEMPFWNTWKGALSTSMVISLIFNLTMIAVGLGAAWKHCNVAGLAPLGLSLVYSLSTALGRYSGWRLILPADWVVLMYYAIGIGQISLWGYAYLDGRPAPQIVADSTENTQYRFSRLTRPTLAHLRSSLPLMVVFLILGLSPLLVENWIKPRYAPIEKDAGLNILRQLSAEDEQTLRRFWDDEHSVVLEGQAFYPRYYKPRQGEPGGDWAAYAPRDYARLGFSLVGHQQEQVILRLDSPPEAFPNAAEVIVIGCSKGDFVDAWAVVLPGAANRSIMRTPPASLSCPLPSR